jgi:formylglycine-generating enzyme required for sulfatase activity
MNRPKQRYFRQRLGLGLSLILLGLGCGLAGPTTEPAPSPGPGLPNPANLVALETMVNRLRGSALFEVQKDTSADIEVDDRVTVDERGRGLLRFQDQLQVELFRNTELQLAEARFEPGQSIFVRLKQTFGHSRTELNQAVGARVTLETDYATIRALDDQTEFLVCHGQALTCMMTLQGETEVEAQGQVVTVPAGQATYIFPGQPPQPPIQGDPGEVSQWLDQKRGSAEVEALGALVLRWSEGEAAAPALPSGHNMIGIAGGIYPVGTSPADDFHISTREITVADFWIDQYEVTNAQYQQFLAETGHSAPAGWPNGMLPAGQGEFPVRGLTWAEAEAYCAWAGKRLPGEAEWEIAARGLDGRLYPWGNNQGAVNLPQSGTYRVGSKLTNQSPFGLFDMAGNVWEWVGEPYAPIQPDHRIIRGGANDLLKDMAYRLQGDPNTPTMFSGAGVRCAADQVEAGPAPAQSSGQVLYQDTFADPSSSWPIQADGTGFFGYHPPDFYHVQVGTPQTYMVVSQPLGVDDAIFEMDVLVDHTATASGNFRYGLAFRRTAPEQFYAFVISPQQGHWAVLKGTPAGLEVLAQGQISGLAGFVPNATSNQTDALRVVAQGDRFEFYINDQPVAQLNDPSYREGEVGFYAETLDEPLAHIHFDSLTIQRASDPGLGQERDTLPPPPTTPDLEPATCTVVTSGLNLRDGPGTNYSPLTALPNGAVVEPLARNLEGTWIQVRVPGREGLGWLNARPEYVSCTIPTGQLPTG